MPYELEGETPAEREERLAKETAQKAAGNA